MMLLCETLFAKIIFHILIANDLLVKFVKLSSIKQISLLNHQTIVLSKAGGSGRAARAMALPHFGLSHHVTMNEW